MRIHQWCALGIAGLLVSSTLAQPVVDGVADDAEYGAAQALQFNETQFGETRSESVNFGSGSQIDGLFGYRDPNTDTLYLTFAGNLESNGNRLMVFIDSQAGGQNQLAANNPDLGLNDFLNRMGPDLGDPNFPGMKFAAGFTADYVIAVSLDGTVPRAFVDFAALSSDPNVAGTGYFVGDFFSRCLSVGGAKDPNTGDPNAPALLLAYDNSNEIGVASANGGAAIDADGGQGNILGIEMAIPLIAIGSPVDSILITAGIVSNDGVAFSNQFMGSLTDGFTPAFPNLEESRQIDLSTIAAHSPVSIGIGAASDPIGGCTLISGNCQPMTLDDCDFEGGTFDPNGCADRCLETAACCVDSACSIETEAFCVTNDGLWIASQADCSLSPCDPNELYIAGGWNGFDRSAPMPRISPGVFEHVIDPGLADPNTRYQFLINRVENDEGDDSRIFGSDHWLYTDLSSTNTVQITLTSINDGWLPDINRVSVAHHDPVPWTVTGSHLPALGGNDWDNASPEGAMDGDPVTGQFTYSVDLPVGTYNWKPVQTGSWDSVSVDTRSINTANVETVLDPNLADPNGLVNLFVELDVPGGRVRVTQSTPGGGFLLGDVNCDGLVDVGDISPFINALLDAERYAQRFPDCNRLSADINEDGDVDAGDISPFVRCILDSGCP